MEIIILLGAQIEIQAAHDHYLAYGTADLLGAELDLAFEQLAAFPRSAPAFAEPIRRLVFRDYPYALFYTVEGNRIIIQAFLNTHQHPEAIRRRLNP